MPQDTNLWQPARPWDYGSHTYDPAGGYDRYPWSEYSTGHLASFDRVRSRSYERPSWRDEMPYTTVSEPNKYAEALESPTELTSQESYTRDLLTPISTREEKSAPNTMLASLFDEPSATMSRSEMFRRDRVGRKRYAQLIELFRDLRRSRALLSYQILRQREQTKFVSRKRDHILDLVAQMQQQIEGLNHDTGTPSRERFTNLVEAIRAATIDCSKAEDTLTVIEEAMVGAEGDLKAKEERLRVVMIPEESPGVPPLLNDGLDITSLPDTLPSEASSTCLSRSLGYQIQVRLSLIQQHLLRDALFTPLLGSTGLIDLDALLDSSSAISSGSSIVTTTVEERYGSLEQHDHKNKKQEEIKPEFILFGEQFLTKRSRSPSAVSSKDSLLSSTALQRRKRLTDCSQVIADAVAAVDKEDKFSKISPLSFKDVASAQRGQLERFMDIGRRSWLDFSRLLRHIEVLAEGYGKSFKFLKKLDLLAIDQLLGQIQSAGCVQAFERQGTEPSMRTIASAERVATSHTSDNERFSMKLSYAARLQPSITDKDFDTDAEVRPRPGSAPVVFPRAWSSHSASWDGASDVVDQTDKESAFLRPTTSPSVEIGSDKLIKTELRRNDVLRSEDATISIPPLTSLRDCFNNLLTVPLQLPIRSRSEPGNDYGFDLPNTRQVIRKTSTQ